MIKRHRRVLHRRVWESERFRRHIRAMSYDLISVLREHDIVETKFTPEMQTAELGQGTCQPSSPNITKPSLSSRTRRPLVISVTKLWSPYTSKHVEQQNLAGLFFVFYSPPASFALIKSNSAVCLSGRSLGRPSLITDMKSYGIAGVWRRNRPNSQTDRF